MTPGTEPRSAAPQVSNLSPSHHQCRTAVIPLLYFLKNTHARGQTWDLLVIIYFLSITAPYTTHLLRAPPDPWQVLARFKFWLPGSQVPNNDIKLKKSFVLYLESSQTCGTWKLMIDPDSNSYSEMHNMHPRDTFIIKVSREDDYHRDLFDILLGSCCQECKNVTYIFAGE